MEREYAHQREDRTTWPDGGNDPYRDPADPLRGPQTADRTPAGFMSPEDDLRRRAVERLRARRQLAMSAVWFVLVNAMLVFFWYRNGGGFFWPIFPMFFWGIGLAWQAVEAFGRGDTEERIQREMRRLSGR